MSAASEDELLTVRETAKRLMVHENTIRSWESKGILRAVHLPGSGFRRFSAHDIDQMRKEMFAHLAPADAGPVVEPTIPLPTETFFGEGDQSVRLPH